MSMCSSRRRHHLGFTLIEAMFLMTIMSVIALGAGVALQSLARVPQKNDEQLAITSALVDKMEELRGKQFTDLTTGSGFSDYVTINKIAYQRSVTVATADATGGSSPNTDFKRITVSIGTRSLSCFVTQP